MGCTIWGVSIQDCLLLYGMGCYDKGWGISKRDGVLVYGMGC